MDSIKLTDLPHSLPLDIKESQKVATGVEVFEEVKDTVDLTAMEDALKPSTVIVGVKITF